MSTLRQIAAVTGMNLKSVPERLGSSAVVVVGIMGLVAVLVSVLTLGTSIVDAMRAAGREDRAVVLRSGADVEGASTLFVGEAQTIADAPGIARMPGGDAAATADMVTSVRLPRKLDGTVTNLTVRGVSPQTAAVRPEIELVEGRMFTPGLPELIVGRSARAELGGLEVGDRVALRGGEWSVVGVYEAGNAWESMLLTDVSTLLSAYQRNVFSSVTVMLESADSFEAFEAALTTDPTLSVDVAALGGLAGVTLAGAALGGSTFSLGTDLGSIAAQLRVTPELLVVGLVWACAVGCLGGLFPAIRAARLPVAAALRAV